MFLAPMNHLFILLEPHINVYLSHEYIFTKTTNNKLIAKYYSACQNKLALIDINL